MSSERRPNIVVAAPVSIFESVPKESRVSCGDCKQECAADANTIRYAAAGIPICCTVCAARKAVLPQTIEIVNENDYIATPAFQHLLSEARRQGGLN